MLQLLADTSGQNIVVSDTVQGSVTLRLQNVPWDQALDIVMTTKGLDMRRNGNVIIVAPAEEIAAREKAELEAQQGSCRAGAAAHRVPAGQLRQGGRARRADQVGEQQLAAVRARQRRDRRAHQHAARAGHGGRASPTSAGWSSTLDIPVRQVLIEARIVIVNDDFSRELGVRFGAHAAFDHGGSDGLASSAAAASAPSTIDRARSLDNLAAPAASRARSTMPAVRSTATT